MHRLRIMDSMKIAFFTNNKTITAIEHIRVLGPISYTDMELIWGADYKNNLLDCIGNADLVIMQRDFPEDQKFYSQVIQISRKQKKPVIYDIDDNLFALPEDHPDRKSFVYSKALMPMLVALLNVDYVTVPNEYLKQKLSWLNNNIFVLPNYLDEKIWSFKLPTRQEKNETLVLGYMGGNTHKPDIESIAHVLLEIKNQFQGKVHFHFYGIKPPEELLSFPDTIWTPTKTYGYRDFAKDLQNADFDFFIAPLVDNEFNRCKSSLKFLEYSALGAPGIYSRLTPYQEIVEEGVNGLFASSADEWKRGIQLLINNPDIRYQLVMNAQNFIKNNFLMSQNSDHWKSLYRKIIEKGLSEHKNDRFPKTMIEDISHQLLEYHSESENKIAQCYAKLTEAERITNIHKHEIKELNDEISSQKKELNNEISLLKEELSFYALSKSWRFTRPLRKIRNIIRGRD